MSIFKKTDLFLCGCAMFNISALLDPMYTNSHRVKKTAEDGHKSLHCSVFWCGGTSVEVFMWVCVYVK